MSSAAILTDVTGDLFVGEAKMFFADPRHKRRSPYRLETATTRGGSDDGPVSFDVRVFGTDMVVLCDSRLNASRVVDALYASDIGSDTDVPAHDVDNARRWTNLVVTSDGRHWSEGEDVSPKTQHTSIEHTIAPGGVSSDPNTRPPTRIALVEEAAIARLTAQLPREAAEAVRDGRSVVVSRTQNLLLPPPNGNGWVGGCSREANDGLRIHRLVRSFNNRVYALCRDGTGHGGDGGGVAALLFVGRFWPKETVGDKEPPGRQRRPSLTVVRKRGGETSCRSGGGGRVFCICLGSRLESRLYGKSAEEIAKSHRHYEGYFGRRDYDSFSKTKGHSGRRARSHSPDTRSRSRSPSPSRKRGWRGGYSDHRDESETSNRTSGGGGKRVGGGVATDVGNVWYCLRCKKHTDTVDIVRKVFTTKNGMYRRYHAGRCARCDCKKAHMKPW